MSAAINAAFVDQTGGDVGGAQLSLSLLLQHLPATIRPHCIFFQDGVFAAQMRERGIPTVIVALGQGGATSTRESPRFDAVLELPRVARAIGVALKEWHIDVVHTNSVKAHVFGGAAALITRTPAVAHLRDIISGLGLFGVRTIVAGCTRERIAISSAVAHRFRLPKTTVVKNPLDLSLYRNSFVRAEARRRLGIPPDGPLVAIVGRINRWKGQDRFLRALAAVNAVVPVRGAIVGSPIFRDADFLPELHALRDALGLRERVAFIDWVEDPRNVYAAIDLHVNASTAEPFGRTTIEAAAMGVPSICFDDSGVAETMLDGVTGIVVPAGDEKALADGILRLASDRVGREAAGEAAREWSNQFDAGVHAKIVASILRRVATPAR